MQEADQSKSIIPNGELRGRTHPKVSPYPIAGFGRGLVSFGDNKKSSCTILSR